MIKLLLSVFALFSVFVSASAVTDEKHCAPRACCGCPGNGRSQVKVLMNVFLDKLAANERTDAFQLASASATVTIDRANNQSCELDDESITDFFTTVFPVGAPVRNVDFDYVMHHDGTIEANFMAVVVLNLNATKVYDMSYFWAQDAQCNWHISKIFADDIVCTVPRID